MPVRVKNIILGIDHHQIENSRAIKTWRQNSLFYKGIETINNLPKNILEATSERTFKKLLREHEMNSF